MKKAKEVFDMIKDRKKKAKDARATEGLAMLTKMRTYIFDTIDKMEDYTITFTFDKDKSILLDIVGKELEQFGFDIKKSSTDSTVSMVASVDKFNK